MSIADNIRRIKSTLPPGVDLVAVSKFHPVAELQQAYDAGQRIFGESRVQELVDKVPQLPGDVRWHFIGHVQTNKAKALIGRTALIESIDSERLLGLIDRLSSEAGTVTEVLLQVHVAAEEAKYGFTPAELLDYFAGRRYESLRATHIRGLMAMATNTDDAARIAADFATAAALKARIEAMCPELRRFDLLSMGMSDDYPAAIAAGSNLIRIGTAIFGARAPIN